MIIGSISENKDFEKRIAITPDIAKKYIDLGFEIQLSENYGEHLGLKKMIIRNLELNLLMMIKKL